MYINLNIDLSPVAGADPGFQVRGAHLKKLRRAEGGAKIFGVFRVKNHDFTPKNDIFSNFRGGRAPAAPPPGSALRCHPKYVHVYYVCIYTILHLSGTINISLAILIKKREFKQ